MRAAVLTDTETLELRSRERPSPAPEEVLVAVREVGICGSDVHYWRHGRIGEYVVEAPLVLGHEVAGEVVETGEAVTGLAAGDRVALEPGVPCRRCEHCAAGRYNRCPDVRFMATPPHDGALAEYVAWPADFAARLPESVSTREGALCEPLSVGVHAARRGGVGIGDSVLVTGCGPVGLLAADAARAAGATEVVVSDVVATKLSRARDRGADLVVDAAAEDVPATVRDHTDGGVDVAVEASGTRAGIETAFAAVRRGGDVVLVGLPGEDGTVPVDILSLVDDELDVHGSFRYANTYPAAVSLFAGETVDGGGLVDETFPLDAVGDAFRRAAAPETVKVVVSLA
jgi:L-iditol 2-dehydrogenase